MKKSFQATMNCLFVLLLVQYSYSNTKIEKSEDKLDDGLDLLRQLLTSNNVQLVNLFNNKCAAAQHVGDKKLTSEVCNQAAANQKFNIVRVKPGEYTISNFAFSGIFPSGCFKRGFPIAQRWIIEPWNRRYFRIRNPKTNMCLDFERVGRPRVCGYLQLPCDRSRRSQAFSFKGRGAVVQEDNFTRRGYIKSAVTNRKIPNSELKAKNFRIVLKGQDGSTYRGVLKRGSIYEVSAPKGTYNLIIKINKYVTYRDTWTIRGNSGVGRRTNTVILAPVIQGWRAVLTWGDEPKDLDFHCILPDGNAVDYNDRKSSDGKVSLDVDVQDGDGPETITLKKITHGKYHLWADNYSQEVTFAKSNAIVTIYSGSRVRAVVKVPTTNNDADATYWDVGVIDATHDKFTPINKVQESQPGSD